MHISFNTGGHALPDMYALTRGCHAYISDNASLPVLQLLNLTLDECTCVSCRFVILEFLVANYLGNYV